MRAPAAAPVDDASILAELTAVQLGISEAADAILFATELSLARLAAARAGEAGAIDDIERALCAILGACAFQDLSGQRLAKIEGWISGTGSVGDGDPLAHGPARQGEGLNQDAADALFADGAGGR